MGYIFCRGTFAVTTYLDADWAGGPDDRRSTSRYAIFISPNLFSWNAKKQPTISKSSTDSNYRSLAPTTA